MKNLWLCFSLLIHSRRVVVSYKQKCVHKVLGNSQIIQITIILKAEVEKKRHQKMAVFEVLCFGFNLHFYLA